MPPGGRKLIQISMDRTVELVALASVGAIGSDDLAFLETLTRMSLFDMKEVVSVTKVPEGEIRRIIWRESERLLAGVRRQVILAQAKVKALEPRIIPEWRRSPLSRWVWIE